MAGEATDDGAAMKANYERSVVPGAVVMVLGSVALAIAAVDYFVFAAIAEPTDGGSNLFGLSFGTTAYVAGYMAAGVILIAVGIWKVYRARSGA